MPVRINGSTSGYVELAAPAVAGSTSLTLPLTGFGKVLQVVQAKYATETTVTSGSWTASGLSASITPNSSSSQIIVLISSSVKKTGGVAAAARFTIFRGTVSGTNLASDTNVGFSELYSPVSGGEIRSHVGITYVDSPSTTASVTYTFAMKCSGSESVVAQNSATTSTMTLVEIGP